MITKDHFDHYFKARREAENLYTPMSVAMHNIAEHIMSSREYMVEQVVIGSQHTTITYKNRFYTNKPKLHFDLDPTLLYDSTEEKIATQKAKIEAVLKALR